MPHRIELLNDRHNCEPFCSEEESLNIYIKQYARQDIRKNVAKAHVLIDEPCLDVLGFYTLSSYCVEIAYFDNVYPKRNLPRYDQIPATLLGRLAVSKDFAGRGLGEILLMNALRRSLDYSKEIGSIAVVVDALNEKSARFYLRYEFIETKDNPLKLFYPISKIQKLFP